jgi:hypothetical protein
MRMSKRRSCSQNTHRETCSLGGFSETPTDASTREKRQTSLERALSKGVASFGARRVHRLAYPNPAFYKDLLRNRGEAHGAELARRMRPVSACHAI